MKQYNLEYVVRVRRELAARYERLAALLDGETNQQRKTIQLSALDIRLAISDFETILKELKKIK